MSGCDVVSKISGVALTGMADADVDRGLGYRASKGRGARISSLQVVQEVSLHVIGAWIFKAALILHRYIRYHRIHIWVIAFHIQTKSTPSQQTTAQRNKTKADANDKEIHSADQL